MNNLIANIKNKLGEMREKLKNLNPLQWTILVLAILLAIAVIILLVLTVTVRTSPTSNQTINYQITPTSAPYPTEPAEQPYDEVFNAKEKNTPYTYTLSNGETITIYMPADEMPPPLAAVEEMYKRKETAR